MNGRKIGLAGAIVAAGLVGLWFYLSPTPRPDPRGGRAGADPSADPAVASARLAAATAEPGRASAYDGAALRSTLHDPAVREEMRRRIMEAALRENGVDEPVPKPPSPLEPMPVRPDGKIDETYLRERFREDLIPMAKDCYKELLARDAKAAGKIDLRMTIVGDDKIGGVVDQAAIGDAGTLHDDKLDECVRESAATLSFRPPPHGGSVTVVLPLTFSPDPPDGAAPGR